MKIDEEDFDYPYPEDSHEEEFDEYSGDFDEDNPYYDDIDLNDILFPEDKEESLFDD